MNPPGIPNIQTPEDAGKYALSTHHAEVKEFVGDSTTFALLEFTGKTVYCHRFYQMRDSGFSSKTTYAVDFDNPEKNKEDLITPFVWQTLYAASLEKATKLFLVFPKSCPDLEAFQKSVKANRAVFLEAFRHRLPGQPFDPFEL